MGRLTTSHWARLVTMSAAGYHILAAIQGFFWPKIFWDFSIKALDPLVRPVPVLQTVNLLAGLAMLALELPLRLIAGSSIHRSIGFRLAILPLVSLPGIFLYQATNAVAYYLIAEVIYFNAYKRREVITPEPWTDISINS
ncbi:PRO41 protein [Podospora didyma]|uniref:PRO41 protein n=1 Tax=Podospora didyma TaxID=330526 RepID=A0AAE0P0V3_9PEZI|nr:PRO41 protein [Podospora didyma]